MIYIYIGLVFLSTLSANQAPNVPNPIFKSPITGGAGSKTSFTKLSYCLIVSLEKCQQARSMMADDIWSFACFNDRGEIRACSDVCDSSNNLNVLKCEEYCSG